MSHQENPTNGTGASSTRVRISNITGRQVQKLLAKLDIISRYLPLELELHEIISPNDYTAGEVSIGNSKNRRGDDDDDDDGNDDDGGGGKHVLQEVSIIGHLRWIGALNGYTTRAIELGAGTGRLSDRLQRVTDASLDHILIDRQEFTDNHCRDRILRARSISIDDKDSSKRSNSNKKMNQKRTKKSDADIDKDDEAEEQHQQHQQQAISSSRPLIQRVVVDIAKLNMEEYCYPTNDDDVDDDDDGKNDDEKVNDKSGNNNSISRCLCMSKHLCGPASDLAISSLLRLSSQQQQQQKQWRQRPSQQQQQQQQKVQKLEPIRPNNTKNRPSGAIATCCHYLCCWETFVGKKLWISLGLTQDDFIVAVAVSQWASLQPKKKRKRRNIGQESGGIDDKNSNVTNKKNGRGTPQELPDLYKLAMGISNTIKEACLDDETNTLYIPSKEFERAFSRQQKASLGSRVKVLLDITRGCTLQETGYHIQLVRYTTLSIEDRLLLMWEPS